MPSAESPALPPLSDAPLSDRGPSSRASLEQLTVAALLPVMQLTLLVRRAGVVTSGLLPEGWERCGEAEAMVFASWSLTRRAGAVSRLLGGTKY